MKWRKYVWFKPVLVALLTCFVLAFSLLSPKGFDHPLDRIGYAIQYPLVALQGTISGTHALFENLMLNSKQHGQILAQLRRQKDENVDLRKQLMMQERLKLENQSLRDLLNLKRQDSSPFVPMNVIQTYERYPFHSLKISGDTQAIRFGQLVTHYKGVVGRIVKVGNGYAEVQTVYDQGFYIEVYNERTLQKGLLKGHPKGLLQMKIPVLEAVKIGDRIMVSSSRTSSHGFPVGMVKEVRYEASRSYITVFVDPFVSSHGLSFVAVNQDGDTAVPSQLSESADRNRVPSRL